ncbi:hypothetical protein GCM10010420_08080 [Streptomyces glaucosporus]|uniref:Uncharacterized protein n=1 Tax=Streptomyces glaucosporus TaxID=284044 RepID=A0ABP5UUB5_9ACTN
MESRTQQPSAVFADSEDFARATRDAGVRSAAQILVGLGDRGFWWTAAPGRAPAAPAFVPTVPLAELPESAVAALRAWAAR